MGRGCLREFVWILYGFVCGGRCCVIGSSVTVLDVGETARQRGRCGGCRAVCLRISIICLYFVPFWISHVLAFLQVSCIILSLISLYFHILFIIFYSSHLLAFRNLLYSSDCLIFLKFSHISLSFDKFPYIYRFSHFSRLRFSF